MLRFFSIIAALLSVNAAGITAATAATQEWACAVNLQQGDAGSMSLVREGDQVDGVITITRNDSVFESAISGRWNGNTIDLKRLHDANTNQPFAGIVVTLGTEKVKIGGRFSNTYQGVWSADCDLVSSSPSNGKSNTASDTAQASVEPSITSRVTPSNPSDKDRVTLSAQASHPDGIKTVSFYIGDKKIHSCNGDSCKFTHAPLSAGKYVWHVEAVSQSGVKNSKNLNDFVVRVDKRSRTCTISGLATGPSAELSISYRVNLLASNNSKRFKSSRQFKRNAYEFTNIPVGNYVLEVDTVGDTSVLIAPQSANIACTPQGRIKQNFDLR